MMVALTVSWLGGALRRLYSLALSEAEKLKVARIIRGALVAGVVRHGATLAHAKRGADFGLGAFFLFISKEERPAAKLPWPCLRDVS